MKPPSNFPQPTRQLGEAGLDLWRSIQAEYMIEDSAGIEVLMQACAALDRAESLAAQIAADGITVDEASVLYDNDLLEPDERAELIERWREHFDKAQAPGFSYCVGQHPTRPEALWLSGRKAREAHYRWADIPREPGRAMDGGAAESGVGRACRGKLAKLRGPRMKGFRV